MASALEPPVWAGGWCKVLTGLWMKGRGTEGHRRPQSGSGGESARWGVLLAPWRSGLGKGFLNCFIWYWGCFYRSLEVMVKDAHRLNKPKLWAAGRHGRDGSLHPFPVCAGGCPRHRGPYLTAWLRESRQREWG